MTTTRNGGPAVEHPIGARGELILRLTSGKVTVTGSDRDTVAVRDLDGRDLDERFVVERGDGQLTIRPRDRAVFDIGLGRRGRGTARLAVELPRTATVSLDTANGELEVTGLRGDQRYRTASGHIAAEDVSGPIAVDAVSGDVEIQAVGPVELSGRLVSGDLTMRGGTLRSVAIATTSGDLRLDAPLEGPGPFSIQTVSGDALVVSAGGLRVEARTLTGEIASELDHRSETGIGRRDLVIGTGSRTLTFKSISGDLRVAAHHPGGADAADGMSRAAAVIGPPAAPEPAVPPAPEPPPAPEALAADAEGAGDERLAILRDLEAGVIDVGTATERLAALDEPTDA